MAEEIPAPVRPEDRPAVSEDPVVEDVLVEEVSIDGMCGVY
ncbi:mycofactocin precursor MftA [Streptomyces sp. NPDC048251]